MVSGPGKSFTAQHRHLNREIGEQNAREKIVLGEISPRLKKILEANERAKIAQKEKKAKLRTYAPPEDDLPLQNKYSQENMINLSTMQCPVCGKYDFIETMGVWESRCGYATTNYINNVR